MQIGIDSFAAAHTESSQALSATERIGNLIEELLRLLDRTRALGLNAFILHVRPMEARYARISFGSPAA